MKDLTLPTLSPCPFCGGGTTEIQENGKVWSGMKYSEPASVSVRHWCDEVKGQPSRLIERVGRDEASAIEAWNRRAALSEPIWCSCGDAITPDTGAKCGVCASGVALGGEKCNPHPDAPHGFNRNASHNAGRYVCDCEGWAALGGEKGEAVADEKLNELLDAYAEIAHQNGVEFCAGNEGDLEGELTAKRAVLALFAAPVGKARMLTDEEADHITGMHNTGRSQGDSECAEAIQRKFCEVNGITLEGGNRSGG